MKHITITALLVLTTIISVSAQTESSYDVGGDGGVTYGPAAPGASASLTGPTGGLLDPSRFTVNHAMSFMAGGPSTSNLKSQSVYSTMMQYRFNAPVVLALNFDMPLHSTFNQYNNLSQENLESSDYFRNMPIDVSLSWYPTDNFMMRVSVHKMPESGYYGYPGGFYNNNWYRADRMFRPQW